jgi:hypothetical protein
MSGIRLTVLTCGHTTLDYDLVATAHPNPEVSRHLMPCCHPSTTADGRKIAHPVYAYVIHHPEGLIVADTGMSDTFSRDWKNDYYRDTMAYDPGAGGLFAQRLQQLDIKPEDVDDLIVTHLHTDHAGNLPLFARTKARIIVHEDELRGAVSIKGGLLRDDLVTLWGVTSPQGFTRRDFTCLLPDRATPSSPIRKSIGTCGPSACQDILGARSELLRSSIMPAGCCSRPTTSTSPQPTANLSLATSSTRTRHDGDSRPSKFAAWSRSIA